MATNLLIGCIAGIGAVQAAYLLLFFRRIFNIANGADGITHRAAVPKRAAQPFTVIICARNEAVNLEAFLPGVLTQDYRFESGDIAFEVIVVNDGSTDDTGAVLQRLAAASPQLRAITIDASEPRGLPGKKFPLSKALAAARYDWIACIDADCAPATDAWLHCLAVPLLQGRDIVVGYGGYVLQKGSVNTFTRWETMHTFLLCYSLTKAGFPYMAVGRNLAATKAAFLHAQAKPLWLATPSGDDDLLVRICGNGDNVAVITHPASFTWTASKKTWKEYFAQKRRHVSTGKLYSWPVKLLLGVYAGSIALALLAALGSLAVNPPLAVPALAMLAIPALAFTEGSPQLRQRTGIIKWMAFLFCWTLYNAVLAPYILWKTKQRWK